MRADRLEDLFNLAATSRLQRKKRKDNEKKMEKPELTQAQKKAGQQAMLAGGEEPKATRGNPWLDMRQPSLWNVFDVAHEVAEKSDIKIDTDDGIMQTVFLRYHEKMTSETASKKGRSSRRFRENIAAEEFNPELHALEDAEWADVRVREKTAHPGGALPKDGPGGYADALKDAVRLETSFDEQA